MTDARFISIRKAAGFQPERQPAPSVAAQAFSTRSSDKAFGTVLEMSFGPGFKTNDTALAAKSGVLYARMTGHETIDQEANAMRLLAAVTAYAKAEGLDLDKLSAIAARIDPYELLTARNKGKASEAGYLGLANSEMLENPKAMGTLNMMVSMTSHMEQMGLDFQDTLANIRAGRNDAAPVRSGPRF